MTIDSSGTAAMTQMMQNSDALIKLSQAGSLMPPSMESGASSYPDPTSDVMQALNYTLEGDILAMQGAVMESLSILA